jgi:hypothetical protein
MKSLLIAAGLATAMLGFAVPAAAQDTRPRMDQRDRASNDSMARNDDRSDRRHDSRWGGRNDRRSGWNNRRCHNVKRHHRWVRVCGRR